MSEGTHKFQSYSDVKQKTSSRNIYKKYLISSALHVALLTAVTEAEVWNTVSIQYNKTTLILMDLFVTSWHREHVCCVQMYIETWVCVCVLLIRQRRGQLFLIRGSIATVITHGWAALTGLFFYLSKMSWIPGLITSALPTPFHCFIAILLHTDNIKYCRGLAICGALLTVYNLKECIQCFCGSTASVSKMGNLKQLRHKGK